MSERPKARVALERVARIACRYGCGADLRDDGRRGPRPADITPEERCMRMGRRSRPQRRVRRVLSISLIRGQVLGTQDARQDEIGSDSRAIPPV
jgi:hypothetical protein